MIAWRRAKACSESGCVEVAPVAGAVWVRDSKLGDASPVLRFDRDVWAGFVAMVKGGGLDDA